MQRGHILASHGLISTDFLLDEVFSTVENFEWLIIFEGKLKNARMKYFVVVGGFQFFARKT